VSLEYFNEEVFEMMKMNQKKEKERRDRRDRGGGGEEKYLLVVYERYSSICFFIIL